MIDAFRRLHPVVGAAIWMTGTLTAFMAMAVAGRELSSDYNTFQMLFWRSLVGLIVVSLLLSRSGWYQVKTRQPGKQVIRNLIHFCGQFGWFYGVAHIAIAEVFTIEFTAPMWTLLLAALFLGEKVTPVRLVAVIFGFVGILVILRPGFQAVEVAQLAVLGAAFCFAASLVITKRLVATDTALTVIFYMTVIQLPLGLFASIDGWVWPTLAHVPWIVAVGVSALAAHFCIANAMKLADASIVVPMDFLRVPLAAFIGYLLYADVIDWWLAIGALIIFVGNLVNVRAESRK